MAEKEYIERNAVVNGLRAAIKKYSDDKSEANIITALIFQRFAKEIEAIPAADVEPVRHGHIIWKRRRRGGFRHVKCLHRFCNFVIEDNAPCKHIAKIDERYTTDEPYCSECGKLLGNFLNYCGNCGARMDGEPDANSNDNKTPET